VDSKQDDLPALAEADMPAWWAAVQKIPNEVHREALLFCLLSGLRRNSCHSACNFDPLSGGIGVQN